MGGAGEVRRCAGGIGHRHAEGRRLLGHRAANAAEADQAELLASQFHAQHVVQRPATPGTGADDAFTFAQAARHRQDQRPGEVGARIGQHVGRVGDRHAARAAGRHVDVVVAHRDGGHDLHLRSRRVKHRHVDGVGEQAHQRLLARDALQQLVARDRGVARVEVNVACFFKPGNHRRWESSGNKYGWFHEHEPSGTIRHCTHRTHPY